MKKIEKKEQFCNGFWRGENLNFILFQCMYVLSFINNKPRLVFGIWHSFHIMYQASRG